jgi:hypothetical protein
MTKAAYTNIPGSEGDRTLKYKLGYHGDSRFRHRIHTPQFLPYLRGK